MGRNRYEIYEPTHPHFLTCIVLNNPLKHGYVDEAKHWRYSSVRDYEGVNGLLEIERAW
jgi:hypothetical protein